MRWKTAVFPILAMLFLFVTVPGVSQVAPSATQRSFPLVIGGGISDFNLDYGLGRRMEGVTVWADWYPFFVPKMLRGTGIELEGRDINLGRPSSLTRMRQVTGMGAVFYSWRRYQRLHPYGKFLAGIGSIDFPPIGTYDHDSRAIYAFSGGADYRLWRNIWARGDYEYQVWPNLFGRNHALTPNGFTFGASYSFMASDAGR